MVSLCSKRLIRITHVLDHMLQKAKQVVHDHCFFFQAEDGIRDRSPSRGLGDVYKRQHVVKHMCNSD